MWQRFTERARKFVFYAQEEAGKLGENFVGPEHLLLGVTRDPESVGALILEHLGVSLEAVRTASRPASRRRGQIRPRHAAHTPRQAGD